MKFKYDAIGTMLTMLIIISSLVLVSMLAGAQQRAWHIADDIRPGTFNMQCSGDHCPGDYKFSGEKGEVIIYNKDSDGESKDNAKIFSVTANERDYDALSISVIDKNDRGLNINGATIHDVGKLCFTDGTCITSKNDVGGSGSNPSNINTCNDVYNCGTLHHDHTAVEDIDLAGNKIKSSTNGNVIIRLGTGSSSRGDIS